jgi:hypothetical protein
MRHDNLKTVLFMSLQAATLCGIVGLHFVHLQNLEFAENAIQAARPDENFQHICPTCPDCAPAPVPAFDGVPFDAAIPSDSVTESSLEITMVEPETLVCAM